MNIKIKRIYEAPHPDDGYRVLVDRLWPRGLSKEKAQIDEWAKEISPSNELRKWFHANRTKWAEFRRRYFAELEEKRVILDALAKRARRNQVTLLYSSTEVANNNATALADYLKQL
ncbi:conserved hypothetical protein [Candidatus Zixiibacteriota bacterium]|nr:conserved hypothetical protein [candidate division Zixibacteria bacterium]